MERERLAQKELAKENKEPVSRKAVKVLFKEMPSHHDGQVGESRKRARREEGSPSIVLDDEESSATERCADSSSDEDESRVRESMAANKRREAALPNVNRINNIIKSLSNEKLKEPKDIEQFTVWERAIDGVAKDNLWPTWILDMDAPEFTDDKKQSLWDRKARIEAFRIIKGTIDPKWHSKFEDILNGKIHSNAQALWRRVQKTWSPRLQIDSYQEKKSAFYRLSMVSTGLAISEYGNLIQEKAMMLSRIGAPLPEKEIIDRYLHNLLSCFRPYVDKILDSRKKGKNDFDTLEKMIDFIQTKAREHKLLDVKAKDKSVRQGNTKMDVQSDTDSDNANHRAARGLKRKEKPPKQNVVHASSCEHGAKCFNGKCDKKHPPGHSVEKAKDMVAKEHGGPCGTCRSLWHSTGKHGVIVCHKCKKEGHRERECPSASVNVKQNASSRDTRIGRDKPKKKTKRKVRQNCSTVDGLDAPTRQGTTNVRVAELEKALADTVIEDSSQPSVEEVPLQTPNVEVMTTPTVAVEVKESKVVEEKMSWQDMPDAVDHPDEIRDEPWQRQTPRRIWADDFDFPYYKEMCRYSNHQTVVSKVQRTLQGTYSFTMEKRAVVEARGQTKVRFISASGVPIRTLNERHRKLDKRDKARVANMEVYHLRCKHVTSAKECTELYKFMEEQNYRAELIALFDVCPYCVDSPAKLCPCEDPEEESSSHSDRDEDVPSFMYYRQNCSVEVVENSYTKSQCR